MISRSATSRSMPPAQLTSAAIRRHRISLLVSPIQMSYGGGKYDAFVTRLAPQGNSLLYSTLIGGSGEDQAYALALDRQGQVVLAGGTTSSNFPQARNALTPGSIETDIFLSRLSADTSVNFVTASASLRYF